MYSLHMVPSYFPQKYRPLTSAKGRWNLLDKNAWREVCVTVLQSFAFSTVSIGDTVGVQLNLANSATEPVLSRALARSFGCQVEL